MGAADRAGPAGIVTSPPFPHHLAPVNATQAVSSVVRHQWGETGYRIGYCASFVTYEGDEHTTWYVFGIRAGDGSELHLAASRWEDVREVSWTGVEFTLGASCYAQVAS